MDPSKFRLEKLNQKELGLGHVIDGLGSTERRVRSGASHQIHVIAKKGNTIDSVEEWVEIIGENGKNLGRVRPDFLISGLLGDAKAYKPDPVNLKRLFGGSFNFKNTPDIDEALPGQLYKYISEFSKGSFTGKVKIFMGRRTTDITVVTDALIDVVENANQATRSRLVNDFNLRGRYPELRNKSDCVLYAEFLKNFKSNVHKLVEVVE